VDVCSGCGEFQCRGFLSCSTAAGPFAADGTALKARVRGASLTEAQRDSLTPDQVVQAFLNGNARFVSGSQRDRDFLGEMKSSATGQYPAAIVLSCIDSRTPVEVISDLGIGDTFNAKVAGNAVNDDILGSMEYACAVAGAKVVLVMGHTSCGAIKGAIDNVVLGNLTLLLARFKAAIDQTAHEGPRTSKNAAFVDAVARTQALKSAQQVRQRSAVLAELEGEGKIKIVASMYDVASGVVTLL
jgi:carbonic anhydrase